MTTNTQLNVIKLSCVNCGSNLDISQQMSRLACGYCGTQQIVERSGGAIHLRGVTEALSKVQIGTDKTAAELAIVRLSNEMHAVQYQRAEREHYWLGIRNQKVLEWNNIIEARQNSVIAMTIIAGIVAALPSGIIANVSFNIFGMIVSTAEKAALPATIIFLGGCIAAALFIRNLMHKSDKYNPAKLQNDRQAQVAELDDQISKDLGEFDKQINHLNTKIQQNYQIANS